MYVNNINIQGNMEKESTKKMTREDALRRLEEARKLKREYVKELEKKMKEDFKKKLKFIKKKWKNIINFILFMKIFME